MRSLLTRQRQARVGPAVGGLAEGLDFLTHRSRIAVGRVRFDGTGAYFEGGALDAAEATDRFVDEQGGVGAGVVGEDLAPGVGDTNRDGIRE